ncbi:glycyl-tRNA synthetase subunit beta [Thermoanaerobacterium thermosaccharolyticum]|uniref:Glycyl-tRNA synthetase subunit beta n=1 Tax=Thermoanaerobacterium thermosaccharolyticum TaxID=1517 RepID=A0A223HX93_THETR|nr:glycyl-tRNA synthetase subunit beta [Thermoanaerobacterium thermosaccharolyticum]
MEFSDRGYTKRLSDVVWNKKLYLKYFVKYCIMDLGYDIKNNR